MLFRTSDISFHNSITAKNGLYILFIRAKLGQSVFNLLARVRPCQPLGNEAVLPGGIHTDQGRRVHLDRKEMHLSHLIQTDYGIVLKNQGFTQTA